MSGINFAAADHAEFGALLESGREVLKMFMAVFRHEQYELEMSEVEGVIAAYRCVACGGIGVVMAVEPDPPQVFGLTFGMENVCGQPALQDAPFGVIIVGL